MTGTGSPCCLDREQSPFIPMLGPPPGRRRSVPARKRCNRDGAVSLRAARRRRRGRRRVRSRSGSIRRGPRGSYQSWRRGGPCRGECCDVKSVPAPTAEQTGEPRTAPSRSAGCTTGRGGRDLRPRGICRGRRRWSRPWPCSAPSMRRHLDAVPQQRKLNRPVSPTTRHPPVLNDSSRCVTWLCCTPHRHDESSLFAVAQSPPLPDGRPLPFACRVVSDGAGRRSGSSPAEIEGLT